MNLPCNNAEGMRRCACTFPPGGTWQAGAAPGRANTTDNPWLGSCLKFAFAYLGLFVTDLTLGCEKVLCFLFWISKIGYIEDKISC